MYKLTTNSVPEHISFFKVSAALYCDIDEESIHIPENPG
jgi:hypothetical protein